METKKEKFLLIRYNDGVKNYEIFNTDFDKIKKYCLNECMGIQFVISAMFLGDLVKNLESLNFSPPFTLDDFISQKSQEGLIKKGTDKTMQKNFGTADLKLVAGLVIKQTYNFLHKV